MRENFSVLYSRPVNWNTIYIKVCNYPNLNEVVHYPRHSQEFFGTTDSSVVGIWRKKKK